MAQRSFHKRARYQEARKVRGSRQAAVGRASSPLTFSVFTTRAGSQPANPQLSRFPSKEYMRLLLLAISVSDSVTSGAHHRESIVVTLENPVSQGYYLRVRYSKNGLDNISSTFDHGVLEVLLDFKLPLDLRPGVYADSLLFETCTDSSCSSFVTGLSATATVQYTVAGSDALRATLGTSSVNLQAFVTDPYVPNASDIDLTLDGVAAQPFVQVTSTQNALLSVNGFGADNNHYSIRYNPQVPAILGPGVFNDTITITTCLDRNCVNPLPQSPLTLPVQITVGDSADGPNGYKVRLADVTGVSMAWDPARQRFYLSQPDVNFKTHKIVAYDPATAQIPATVPLSWFPSRMAVSDDNQFLYVGTGHTEDQFKRLKLSDLTENTSVDLGKDAQNRPYDVRDIAVAPAQPSTVAVGRSINPGGPETAGLVVFDDTTPRNKIVGAVPDLANGPVIDHMTWGADTTHIFASNESGQNPEVYDIAVDASGGHIVRKTSAAVYGRLHFAGGLLYTDNGLVFDTATLAQVARLVPTREGSNGIPWYSYADVAKNRIYVIASFPQLPLIQFHSPLSLVSFDLTQRTQIASISLDPTLSYDSVIRWGNDGLAVLPLPGKLILINGGFVGPSGAP